MALSDAVQLAAVYFGRFSGYLNALVISLVILLSGFIVGRLTDRALRKLFLRMDLDDRLARLLRRRRNYARATRRTLVFAIYLASIYFALRELSADRLAITAITAILVLTALVSLALTAVEIAPNLAGRAHLARRGVTEGEVIMVRDEHGEMKGRVVRITLTDVQLRRANGDMVFYPTAAMLSAKVTRKAAPRRPKAPESARPQARP